MKCKKVLSGGIFGFGCVIVFIGLAATILPMIANDQLRLVLSSFEMPSQNPIVNAINAMMAFSLHNCYLMMLIGAGIALVGALMMLSARPDTTLDRQPSSQTHTPYTLTSEDAAIDNIPVWRSTRAPSTRETNPFADTSLSALLTPKATHTRTQKTEPNPYAPFAHVTVPMAGVPMSESPYAPPRVAVKAATSIPEASSPNPPIQEDWQVTQVPPAAVAQQPAIVALPLVEQGTQLQSKIPQPTVPEQAQVSLPQFQITPPQMASSTQSDTPAKSGSHVVIRSTFATSEPAVDEQQEFNEPTPPATATIHKEDTEVSEATPSHPTSSRIKSTIGKSS